MKLVVAVAVFLMGTVSALAQPPAKVVVSNVFEKEISKTNEMVGILEFDKRSGISPETAGLISEVLFVDGATVRKGDVLARLNTDFIRKNIAIREKESEEVLIRIQNAEKNLKRFELLFKEEAASEKAYDDLADRLAELETQLATVKLKTEKLTLELKKSSIRAPYDGLILEKFKHEGEWVAPGTPICSIGSTNDVVIKVAVSEELVRYIIPGSDIFLSVPAVDKEFKGAVRQIIPVADLATKTFQVKIDIPYFKSAIQNMSATVQVPVSHKMTLRMIKRDALIRYQGKDFIYTVKEDKASILPVHIVVYAGEYMGVDDPYVVQGMPVVIDGNDRLKPDQPVAIIEEKEPK